MNTVIKHHLDRTINLADLGGRRLSLSFTTTAGVTTARFHVDDDELATATAAQVDFPVTLTVKHPLLTASVSPAVIYKRGDGNAYAIGYGFSPTGRLLQRRYDKLDDYLAQGKADSSREVRTEMLNILAQSYMMQRELALRLSAAAAGVLPCTQQCVGRVAQETGYYMDWYLLDTAHFAAGGDQSPARSIFLTETLFASALEHGVVEQYQTNKSGVSTVGVIQRTMKAGDKMYYADSNSVWTASVRPNLNADYTAAQKSARAYA